jgi:hypothetical protein
VQRKGNEEATGRESIFLNHGFHQSLFASSTTKLSLALPVAHKLSRFFFRLRGLPRIYAPLACSSVQRNESRRSSSSRLSVHEPCNYLDIRVTGLLPRVKIMWHQDHERLLCQREDWGVFRQLMLPRWRAYVRYATYIPQSKWGSQTDLTHEVRTKLEDTGA